MNIQDKIPESYVFESLICTNDNWWSCRLSNEIKDEDVCGVAQSPDESLAEACKKACEYNLRNITGGENI